MVRKSRGLSLYLRGRRRVWRFVGTESVEARDLVWLWKDDILSCEMIEQILSITRVEGLEQSDKDIEEAWRGGVWKMKQGLLLPGVSSF